MNWFHDWALTLAIFLPAIGLGILLILPKAEEQLLKTDPHSLGRARINEQVRHQKAFAEAFKCRASDKMSLPDDERVRIW